MKKLNAHKKYTALFSPFNMKTACCLLTYLSLVWYVHDMCAAWAKVSAILDKSHVVIKC